MTAITNANYIAALIGEGLLDRSDHYEVAAVQESFDNERVHVALLVRTNMCGAILDALTKLSVVGLTVCGLYRLHGPYEGGVELDVIVNPRPPRPKKAAPFAPLPMDDIPPEDGF